MQQHNRQHTERRTGRGFTLVELLVSVAVIVLLGLFIGTVFTSVSDAVSSGLSASEVVTKAPVAGRQLDDDVGAMIGPTGSQNGFLVIMHNQITDNGNTNDGVPIVEEEGFRRPVRSDQLLFFAERSHFEASAPERANDYAASTTAGSVRVWYGHARMTPPNGAVAAPDGEKDATGPLGLQGPNRLASDWVLGRHVLFLEGWNQTPPQPNAHPDVTHTDPKMPTKRGTAAYWSAQLHQNKGFQPPTLVANRLYAGVTDRTADSLTEIMNHVSPGPKYRYKRTYLYAFAAHLDGRIRVNPSPVFLPNSPAHSYRAWQVAQQHPMFLKNVSDFAVDFAGDYEDNPDINNATPKPDGRPDVDDDTGQLKWYNHFYNNPQNGSNFTNSGNYSSAFAITYQPATTGSQYGFTTSPNSQKDPIYDQDPQAPNGNALAYADAAMVFRHDGGRGWPYLLRIRYRLHDAQGNVTDHQGNPGRVFEHVIALPVR